MKTRVYMVLAVSIVIISCGYANPESIEYESELPLSVTHEEVVVSFNEVIIDNQRVGAIRKGSAPLEVFREAAGVDEPASKSEYIYILESNRGQENEEKDVSSSWTIKKKLRQFLTIPQRLRILDLARLEMLNQHVNDRKNEDNTIDQNDLERDFNKSIEEEINAIKFGREIREIDILTSTDLEQIEGREEGPVVVDVCGLRLKDDHIPRHVLLSELLDEPVEMRKTVVHELVNARSDRIEKSIDDLKNKISHLQAMELSRSTIDNCFTVEFPSRTAFLALSDVKEVRTAFVVDRADAFHTEGEFDGETTRLAVQIQQFWDSGFQGGTSSNRPGGKPELTAAVIDAGFQDRHLAFNDNSSTSSNRRINGRYSCEGDWIGCGGTTCTSHVNLPWMNGHDPLSKTIDHGTTCASIIAGDFMDGQISTSVVPLSERSGYTGYMPEGGIAMIQSNTCQGKAAAVNLSVTEDYDVISMSVCGGQQKTCSPAGDVDYICQHDCTCDGRETDISDEVNAAFKDGIVTMKAAGNTGAPTSCCACTLTSPADAEGAIAVGRTGTESTVRKSTSPSTSASGLRELRKNGGSREAPIVGISAPGCRYKTAACEYTNGNSSFNCTADFCPCNAADYSNVKEEIECGTSYAAPAVAAASLLLKDEWINGGNPSTLLLQGEFHKLITLFQGDRTNSSSIPPSKRSYGFSSVYGSGRMRMRMFSPEGMDAPWHVNTFWTTLEDGEVYIVPISPTGSLAEISSQVENIKAMAWWYEPRTEQSDWTPAAHILMELISYAGPACTGAPTTYGSDLSYDTRKMVHIRIPTASNAANRCWALRFTGLDVSANDESSNALTRRINVMWAYEDTDRNDPDGPPECDANFLPSNCVEAL